jgi:hypothetical protein
MPAGRDVRKHRHARKGQICCGQYLLFMPYKLHLDRFDPIRLGSLRVSSLIASYVCCIEKVCPGHLLVDREAMAELVRNFETNRRCDGHCRDQLVEVVRHLFSLHTCLGRRAIGN